MDRPTPYSQPTLAVQEQAPLEHYRDPAPWTRFLQLFLGAHIACVLLSALITLPFHFGAGHAMPVFLLDLIEAHVRTITQATLAIGAVCYLALGAWLWRVRENVHALGCDHPPPLPLLLLAGLALPSLSVSLHITSFTPGSIILLLALTVILLAAYAAHAVQLLFQASAAPADWKRLATPPLLRAWLIAVTVQALGPLLLRQRYLTGRGEFGAYSNYAQVLFVLAMVAAEGLLLALAARMAQRQQATHAALRDAAGKPKPYAPAPVPEAAAATE
jgi:hypothetical protein